MYVDYVSMHLYNSLQKHRTYISDLLRGKINTFESEVEKNFFNILFVYSCLLYHTSILLPYHLAFPNTHYMPRPRHSLIVKPLQNTIHVRTTTHKIKVGSYTAYKLEFNAS